MPTNSDLNNLNNSNNSRDEILQNTANDYEKYVKVNLSKELSPIEESIDNMLTRLEEFESLVAMVQQESGNVIGLTGSYTQLVDHKQQLDQLCNKVDILECMVTKVRQTIDILEDKVEKAENDFDHLDNSTFKNFFKPKMFKKLPETRAHGNDVDLSKFSISDYFKNSDSSQ